MLRTEELRALLVELGDQVEGKMSAPILAESLTRLCAEGTLPRAKLIWLAKRLGEPKDLSGLVEDELRSRVQSLCP